MSEILRPGLLDGVSVRVERLGSDPDSRLADSLERLGARMADAGADALVLDCSAWSEEHEVSALLVLLDGVWSAVRAAAVDGFIPSGDGGRILFIAPVAPAAAAALENLSRTLSVEWARHSITAVILVPGAATEPEHLATVVAYLLSPAGAYFSGTRLELDSLGR